jgi:hypothetical protein
MGRFQDQAGRVTAGERQLAWRAELAELTTEGRHITPLRLSPSRGEGKQERTLT